MKISKVLIVEDQPDIRDLIRLALEMDGHEVFETDNADEGVSLATQILPAFILLDLSLAGNHDGLEAATRLRANPLFDQTPIVALTAHAMRGDREKALAAGCDDHWAKPITDLLLFKEMVSRYITHGRNLKSES